ncbi:hypothetical protein KMZ68_08875 [Bradyrhizobium sediminis]|uniref:Uncharacterized protein n=1 Tax=Bradyrhizobium sediminis TaxID=2840469 RepID=A0A975NSI2_9BRAD|nr:hypothetical protein [Bradyrhizobium sediminis]QWG19916.1 hypothetical protein KMZ68_08875 [Bradyrhizobium sediminis]
MTSAVSLRTLANCSSAPIVVFVDMLQEYLAKPRRLAFHHNHEVTFLWAASAGHALDDMSADDVHRAVSRISGLYGEVYETTDWIASALPRKLGYGKNAGG